LKIWRHNGGDSYIARRHRGLLHEAGFIKVLASATAESYGTSEATKSFGEVMEKFMFSHLETNMDLGWVDSKMAKKLTEEFDLGFGIEKETTRSIRFGIWDFGLRIEKEKSTAFRFGIEKETTESTQSNYLTRLPVSGIRYPASGIECQSFPATNFQK